MSALQSCGNCWRRRIVRTFSSARNVRRLFLVSIVVAIITPLNEPLADTVKYETKTSNVSLAQRVQISHETVSPNGLFPASDFKPKLHGKGKHIQCFRMLPLVVNNNAYWQFAAGSGGRINWLRQIVRRQSTIFYGNVSNSEFHICKEGRGSTNIEKICSNSSKLSRRLVRGQPFECNTGLRNFAEDMGAFQFSQRALRHPNGLSCRNPQADGRNSQNDGEYCNPSAGILPPRVVLIACLLGSVGGGCIVLWANWPNKKKPRKFGGDYRQDDDGGPR